MKQAIKHFEQYIKSRYPNSTTARHYGHDLRLFSRFVGKAPRAVTSKDVSRFVEDQLARGLAATTVNRRLAALRQFFEYLVYEAQDAEWPNPVNWKRQRVKSGKTLPRDVSDADVKRLFEQITQPRDRVMFQLMLDVGLRVGEVSALRLSDLTTTNNNSNGRLRVCGKGSKERFVYLLPETLSVVQAWLDQRPAVADEALFVTRRRKGFTVRGIQERLAHYSRLAGVEVSPHQIRHTFGRRMAEAGMPVTSLSALMGHAQVTTTQIYISGAGVELQADYQAAIERLRAARLDDPLTLNDEPGGGTVAAETDDVWDLAGVKPNFAPARDQFLEEPGPMPLQPAAESQTDLSRFFRGLPAWLGELLEAHIIYRQRRWKRSQVRNNTRARSTALRGVWRWLVDEAGISSIADLRGTHVQSYVDARLAAGISSGTVNAALSDLWSFLNYLDEREHSVNPSVFRVKRPKNGDPLPRFLGENEFQRLESAVLQATEAGRRDDLLDRAWFYLLSDAGLRLSEVRDLRLGDVDLRAQRLIVRQGKENRDRCVPLSPTLRAALKAYLPVRGTAQTDHVLTLHKRPVRDSTISGRLRLYGQEAQVRVSPHRLRHTLATRLVNEGMPITSLQRLLGHEMLATTMVYARVHNETVRCDYERAHARLSVADKSFNAPTQTGESQLANAEAHCV